MPSPASHPSPSPSPDQRTAVLLAGVPSQIMPLYHRARFVCGDPAAWLDLPTPDGRERVFLVRDIEAGRARKSSPADRVVIPADAAPEEGLSGDRETATAQAVSELVVRSGAERVIADRSLGLIYADHLRRRGVDVTYDETLGVSERRSKDAQEAEWLCNAQRTTEQAVAHACERIARASAAADGTLTADGEPLTSERVQREITVWLLERGFVSPHGCIVAGLPANSDCHDRGSGPLRTGEPVIIDVFPRDPATLYHGDCTRTVVHGEPTPEFSKMHAAVIEAMDAAIAATHAGTTGDAVNKAATDVIEAHGFALGLPDPDATTFCTMPHGTGHGVGLDVHEPPLLDRGGPELVVGDCLTIEPGLYGLPHGGVRVEDMVIVTQDGCENFNTVQRGLDWS